MHETGPGIVVRNDMDRRRSYRLLAGSSPAYTDVAKMAVRVP